MQLDAYTVNVLVAVTVLSSGTMYLLETLLRRESRVGQLWAAAYLCGMLAVISYVIWQSVPEPLTPIAVGNAALVATVGCLWLGCLRHNGSRVGVPAAVVVGAALAALAAAYIEGERAGDWAGAAVMFAGIAVLAVLGAVESRRGRSRETPTTIGLTVVLLGVAAYYGIRCYLIVAQGPEGAAFRTWFNGSTTGVIMIMLMIVALVTTTTLRNNAVIHGGGDSQLGLSRDGVLTRRSFTTILERILELDRTEAGVIGVIVFRADDLPQIGIAFGAAEQEAVAAMCRRSLRSYAPVMSPVAELGTTALACAVETASASDLRRLASRIQRRMLDDLADRGTAVIPVIGVGVALAESYGHDARALVEAAYQTAGRGATSVDTSVSFAD